MPLQRAFDLIDYLRNETYTAPISEALFQTELIYNLLDKLGHVDLASRLVVSLPFCQVLFVACLYCCYSCAIQQSQAEKAVIFHFHHFPGADILTWNQHVVSHHEELIKHDVFLSEYQGI